MTMQFATRIPARNFGFASKTTIPGFVTAKEPVCPPAQLPVPDPDHVFDEAFVRDFVLWWTSDDTRTPLYISGPTGCGKTSTVLEFLARVNAPAVSVTCSRRFVKDDLVGRWGAVQTGFAWFDGPATIAWKTGAVLLINEFSLAPAEVWVGANDIFEGQAIAIEKTGTTVPRHPNTRVIITDNCRCGCTPDIRYASRNEQDASTCDRFWHLSADWPTKAVETRILEKRCRTRLGHLLRDEILTDLARCTAAFAKATRQKSAKEEIVFRDDAIPAVSTRVVLRLAEILGRLIAAGTPFNEALDRSVTLAIGGALSNARCLAMVELAAFHYTVLQQKLAAFGRDIAPAGVAAPLPEFC